MSYTELIANPDAYADPEKRKAMEQLQSLLTGALEARGRVLLKLNVDAADLDGVIALLPALKSPTVSKLFGEDGFAVETVVSKSEINTLIPNLLDLGANGIIELPDLQDRAVRAPVLGPRGASSTITAAAARSKRVGACGSRSTAPPSPTVPAPSPKARRCGSAW